ncbi:MAG: ribosome biogenesis factor YjgA [Marinicella sp.]
MAKKTKHFEITDFHQDEDDISKTQKKKKAADLRDLAKDIAAMPKSKIAALELPEQFLEAIEESKRITSHIASKRHFQYMGKLLIKLDHVAIQEKMMAQNNMDGHYQIRDEVINAWIEKLVTDETTLIEHLYQSFSHDEIGQLRQTLRNHKKKPEDSVQRKKLFQALRKLDRQQELPHPMVLE